MVFILSLIAAALAVPVQDGDLIFQTSLSAQSEAIQLATDSPFSHVGIIAVQDGEPWVYEAIGPVLATPLQTWKERGEGGRYRVMRPHKSLSKAQIQGMRSVGHTHQGKHYDLRFQWSDTKMYCSELVWKIYKHGAGIELAEPRPMSSYRLSHPTVKALLIKRWGRNISWAEPMVAPSDLADSPLLRVIEDTM